MPVLASIAFLLSTTAVSAATFFTDRVSFNAATQTLALEDFNDNTLAPGLGITTGVGQILLGDWIDTVSRPVVGTVTAAPTTFTFSTGMTAFGGGFDLSTIGLTSGLQFVLDGVTVLSTQLATATPTFFGFVTDTAFTTVTLRGGTLGLPSTPAQNYRMNDMSFGTAAPILPAPVPLPASLVLLLAGLGGLGMMRHRRDAS